MTVKDSAGNTSASRALTIAIQAGVTISTTTLPNGTVGAAYSAQLTASGGTPPYGNWVAGNSLPPGLALNAGTGVIGGTPTTATGSPFSFTVTVKDGAGNTSAPQAFTITVQAGVTISTTTLPNGTVGVAYSAQLRRGRRNFSPTAAGRPAVRCRPGLTLNAATGVIGGTPATATGSPFSFSVTVKDGAGNTSAPQALTITIQAGVTITSTGLPSGLVGIAYSAQLTAAGGTQPYSGWTASGSLPPGLTLNAATGVISGTPTTATGSPFSFTVTVKDGAGNISAPQALTITVQTGVTISTRACPTALPASLIRPSSPLPAELRPTATG